MGPGTGCRVSLVARASPVTRLRGLEAELDAAELYVKREEEIADGYGGSKVRAAELLLGQARAAGADVIVTSGLAGSSYLAAIAHHGRRLGLDCTAWVKRQPASDWGMRNAAIAARAGCRLRLAPPGARLRSTRALLQGTVRDLKKDGATPAVLPFAGSGARGAAGQIAAARELGRQLGPSRAVEIVMPSASGWTAAGLAVGLELERIPARIVAVRVTDDPEQATAEAAVHAICRLLGRGRAPEPSRAIARIETVDAEGRARAGFGAPTEATAAAQRLAERSAGLALEPVYTAGAFAQFVARARADPAVPRLFWHTADCRPDPAGTAALPDGLGHLFD